MVVFSQEDLTLSLGTLSTLSNGRREERRGNEVEEEEEEE
jgi:hypothetical protein